MVFKSDITYAVGENRHMNQKINYSMARCVVYFFCRESSKIPPTHISQKSISSSRILGETEVCLHAFGAVTLKKISLYQDRYLVYEYCKPQNRII